MLTRRHAFLLSFLGLAVSGPGCVITTGAGGYGGTSGVTSGTGNGVTSGTTSAVGTGVTGSTSTVATTGTGACTPQTGTGKSESACDNMPNFPKMCAATGGAPDAVTVCHNAFQVLYPGQWEELEACFEAIPATTDDTCGSLASGDINTCVNQMYAHACTANPNAATKCTAQAQACATSGDPNFATAQCQSDLAPFSDAGINAFLSCAGGSNATCANLESQCYNQVF